MNKPQRQLIANDQLRVPNSGVVGRKLSKGSAGCWSRWNPLASPEVFLQEPREGLGPRHEETAPDSTALSGNALRFLLHRCRVGSPSGQQKHFGEGASGNVVRWHEEDVARFPALRPCWINPPAVCRGTQLLISWLAPGLPGMPTHSWRGQIMANPQMLHDDYRPRSAPSPTSAAPLPCRQPQQLYFPHKQQNWLPLVAFALGFLPLLLRDPQ